MESCYCGVRCKREEKCRDGSFILFLSATAVKQIKNTVLFMKIKMLVVVVYLFLLLLLLEVFPQRNANVKKI